MKKENKVRIKTEIRKRTDGEKDEEGKLREWRKTKKNNIWKIIKNFYDFFVRSGCYNFRDAFVTINCLVKKMITDDILYYRKRCDLSLFTSLERIFMNSKSTRRNILMAE